MSMVINNLRGLLLANAFSSVTNHNLLGMEKLNDLSSYSYVYMYSSVVSRARLSHGE